MYKYYEIQGRVNFDYSKESRHMSAKIKELKAANAMLEQGLRDYAEYIWWRTDEIESLDDYVNGVVKDYTYIEIEDDPVGWRNYDENDPVGALGMP